MQNFRKEGTYLQRSLFIGIAEAGSLLFKS
jgi:hypothetical protein